MEDGARPVIDPNLLEPAALQQMHGGIKHELETMTEARYGMARVAENCMAAKAGFQVKSESFFLSHRWLDILLKTKKLTLEQVKDTKEEGDFELFYFELFYFTHS